MAERDPFLDEILKWKTDSENLRSLYDDRWATNIKLLNGIFTEEETAKSRTRGRSKIFFRKIWATTWRLIASFYTTFLRDQDTFKIEGRDTQRDPHKARILHLMTEYRRDMMMRKDSLFLKFIWGFQNIVNLGWAVGKLSWEYSQNKDGPKFILYPNEQVFPDMTAETKEDMRYIIFENYLTKQDMERLGYDNIGDAESTSIPSSVLRHTRHMNTRDPLQNPGENEYPAPGRYQDERKDAVGGDRYRVWECFHKEDGRIKLTISNEGKVILKKTEDSPYGDRYPVVMGSCLTQAHKLMGEGFPEPLEGPQESYNANLNMRKDNVALALNKMSVVSRYGNVDLQSLVNSRPGGIVLADDINAVKEMDHRDVTQSAYMEAAADEGMMEEMSGIVDIKKGQGKEQKATVAQINLQESNAKIDLYSAIVAETFIRDFYSLLAYLIQRFETDEKVFRVANDIFRQETKVNYQQDIYDLDFEADCIVNVGLGAVGRQTEIQQTLLAMDRAIMANQSTMQLLQMGAVPPQGVRMFDPTAFMEDMLPKLGKKDVERFFVQIPPAQQQGGQNPGLAGKGQPQRGGNVSMANDFQRGGFGGI